MCHVKFCVIENSVCNAFRRCFVVIESILTYIHLSCVIQNLVAGRLQWDVMFFYAVYMNVKDFTYLNTKRDNNLNNLNLEKRWNS